ncbi:unnamed protein product [Mesocestoides corti]|uniref:RUN domain-containing protein n=1 Tax=Mesocestoides corti TaxID=53468 RepID=A0A0R3U5V2_MESCO|nr:unnamed protein product [Mesocestoides corti]
MQCVERWINDISTDALTYVQNSLTQIAFIFDPKSVPDELSVSDYTPTRGDISVVSTALCLIGHCLFVSWSREFVTSTYVVLGNRTLIPLDMSSKQSATLGSTELSFLTDAKQLSSPEQELDHNPHSMVTADQGLNLNQQINHHTGPCTNVGSASSLLTPQSASLLPSLSNLQEPPQQLSTASKSALPPCLSPSIVSDPKSFPDELLISDSKPTLGDTNILSTSGGSGDDGVGEIYGGMQISSLSVFWDDILRDKCPSNSELRRRTTSSQFPERRTLRSIWNKLKQLQASSRWTEYALPEPTKPLSRWIKSISLDVVTYEEISPSKMEITDQVSIADHTQTYSDASNLSTCSRGGGVEDGGSGTKDDCCEISEGKLNYDDYLQQQWQQQSREGCATCSEGAGVESRGNTTTTSSVNYLPPLAPPGGGGDESNYQFPARTGPYHFAKPPHSPLFAYNRNSRSRSLLRGPSNRFCWNFEAWDIAEGYRDNFSSGNFPILDEVPRRTSRAQLQARRAMRNIRKRMNRLQFLTHTKQQSPANQQLDHNPNSRMTADEGHKLTRQMLHQTDTGTNAGPPPPPPPPPSPPPSPQSVSPLRSPPTLPEPA